MSSSSSSSRTRLGSDLVKPDVYHDLINFIQHVTTIPSLSSSRPMPRSSPGGRRPSSSSSLSSSSTSTPRPNAHVTPSATPSPASLSSSASLSSASPHRRPAWSSSPSGATTPSLNNRVADGPNKLYIGGLPIELDETDLTNLLSSFGTLASFHLVRDRNGSGVSKGYAYFEYDDTRVSEVAIKSLNGAEIDGRIVIVRRAPPSAASASSVHDTTTTTTTGSSNGVSSPRVSVRNDHVERAPVRMPPPLPSAASSNEPPYHQPVAPVVSLSSHQQHHPQSSPLRPSSSSSLSVPNATPLASVAQTGTATAVIPSPSTTGTTAGACRQWTAHGNCRFGQSCRFVHSQPNGTTPVPSTTNGNGNGRMSMTITAPNTTISSPLPVPSTTHVGASAATAAAQRSPSFIGGHTSDAPSVTPSRTGIPSSPSLGAINGTGGGGGSTQPGICLDWSQRGTCKNFATCRYAHPAREARPGAPVCFKWAADGKCEFGMACRFSHGFDTSKDPYAELPYEIGGPAMTDDGRAFIQGGQMDDEDRVAEYKECGLTRIPEHRIGEQANTYICAFLNSDTGGSLYCGVRDDGVVTGVVLNREQRDALRLNLDGHIARYQPVPPRSFYQVAFIPVVARDTFEPVVDTFVVQADVQPGWSYSPVFATGDNETWRRYDASVRPMKMLEIIERVRRHYAEQLKPSSASAATFPAAAAIMHEPNTYAYVTPHTGVAITAPPYRASLISHASPSSTIGSIIRRGSGSAPTSRPVASITATPASVRLPPRSTTPVQVLATPVPTPMVWSHSPSLGPR